MTVPGNIDALMLGGLGGYQIERSLRFNSPDTAYLNRTPASAGNRKTWTWSGWVKRSALGTAQRLFNAYSGDENNTTEIGFDSSNRIDFSNVIGGSQAGGFYGITSAVFRDISAWYHIVYAIDTTQSTAAAALKVYVNGVQQTLGTSTYGGGANHNTFVNNTNVHRIGQTAPPNSGYFNGYLTEINFIDGQALTPSSFGETNPVTGVWGPKRYAGTYGTNGFYLKFADNSNTTAATLGKDSSGNGNNWTPNNFSVTAGVGNDSFIDVPTPYADGGNGRGNYCTLNPLFGSTNTIQNGNLELTGTAASSTQRLGTVTVSSGKWYYEVELSTLPASMDPLIGFTEINNTSAVSQYPGQAANSYSIYTLSSNTFLQKVNNNSFVNTNTAVAVQGNVISVALDLDNGKIWFAKNNTWVDSGAPGSGTNPQYTGLSGTFAPSLRGTGGATTTTLAANFGQRPFAYTPPTGFLALNTQNLPEPSIKKPNQWFDATLYTGAGANQSITNSGSMQPSLVWLKSRSNAYSHYWYDAVRGVGNSISSDSTATEQYFANALTLFDSNGFSLGNIGGAINQSGATFVAWQWKESATPGFDIVTYTGNGTNRTIAHSLGVAPKFIITKSRTTADDWFCYHDAIGNTKYILLDSTAASTTSSTIWNNTSPTSSTFSLGTSGGANRNGDNFVAYCFSEVAGFSKFGSYTGNGSADGPFVHCGFRPRWVMVKRTDSTGDWPVKDSSRDNYNAANLTLQANLSQAEAPNNLQTDILSNGFKLRDTGANGNASGGTYIFAAFAESPQKYSLAR
jgi:hypothetical protein